jgi:peptide deformylase
VNSKIKCWTPFFNGGDEAKTRPLGGVFLIDCCDTLHLSKDKIDMIIERVVQKEEHAAGELIKNVKDVSSKAVQSTITNLVDSMRHYNLVGMSAPQIGQPQRIFVVEVRETTYRKNLNIKEGLKIFVNPKIIGHSDEENIDYEGCGSVDSSGAFGPLKRWNQITIEALDKEGKRFVYQAEGLLARVIQHEYDHLDGILFIDKVEDPKTMIGKEEYLKRFKN